LTFSDGFTATADILVGADGVHSATRAAMFKSLGPGYDQYISPVFSGTIAYRGGVPKRTVAEAFPDRTGVGDPRVVRIRPDLLFRRSHLFICSPALRKEYGSEAAAS
jgi:2-polyprenyl-6-methoxyphenol hydroxylase-like FAD-dependent oxidoreductase